jgi:hypothetical protein
MGVPSGQRDGDTGAMAETLTKVCEDAYAALNARDLEAFLDRTDPEIEITSLIAEAEGATFRGHDGVREWWDTVVIGALGGIQFTIDQIRELDHEYMLVELVVSGEAAGVTIEQRMWQSIQVRDGRRAVWWQPYRTEQEALEGIERRRGG